MRRKKGHPHTGLSHRLTPLHRVVRTCSPSSQPAVKSGERSAPCQVWSDVELPGNNAEARSAPSELTGFRLTATKSSQVKRLERDCLTGKSHRTGVESENWLV